MQLAGYPKDSKEMPPLIVTTYLYIDNHNVWKRRILLFCNLKCLVLLNLRTIELKNISLVKEDTYFELGKLNKQTNIQN